MNRPDMKETAIRQMAETRRQQARALRFFDAGIWLGPPVGFPLAEELTVERLPQALSRGFLRGGHRLTLVV